MNRTPVIDAHTHVWPDHLAARALAGRVPGMSATHDGTVSGLLATMDAAGVDRAVVMGIADHSRHVHRTNEFIGSLRSDRLIPFGTVHPELSVAENLDSLRRYRVAGVKLHPLFQGFALDDLRLLELLAAFGDEIPVITHVGRGGTEEANRRATPAMLAALVDALPELRLAACHFGGFHRLEEALDLVAGRPVLLETSWPPALAGLGAARVREVVAAHGADRIVFGSDWPMTNPAAEIATVRGLGLSEAQTAAVLGGNLARWLAGEPPRTGAGGPPRTPCGEQRGAPA